MCFLGILQDDEHSRTKSMKQPRPDSKALSRNRPATVIHAAEIKPIRVSLEITFRTKFAIYSFLVVLHYKTAMHKAFIKSLFFRIIAATSSVELSCSVE